jgi:FkbM family methyltransferase
MNDLCERTTPGGNLAHLEVRTDTNDGAIAQALLQDDEYRLASVHPLTGWAIDIGAHIGTVAVAMALDNPDLRVVAVEAIPENAALVIANVGHNGLTERVFVETAAATDDRESVTISYNYRRAGKDGHKKYPAVPDSYVDQCRYIGNIFEYPAKFQDADSVTVPGLSLAALLDKYAIDRVALLKIDCEGCEWQFLQGPLDRIDRIVGEYHDTGSFDQLLAMLEPTHVVDRWTDGSVGLFGAVVR